VTNKTTDNAAPEKLQDSDNELLRRFLRQIDADASYPRIAAQGISTVSGLRNALKTETTRKALAVALEEGEPTVGDRLTARYVLSTDDTKMDKVLADVDRHVVRPPEPEPTPPAPPVRVSPRANAALTDYLHKKGIAPEMMPVFESHGVTSLEALNRVVSDKGKGDSTYKKLKDALGKATPIDDKIYVGSKEVADGLDSLTLPEIEEAQGSSPADFRKTGLNDAAKERYAQLKAAVQEVDALRQRDADAASELSKDLSDKTQARLESILTRVNSRELLGVFDGNPPTTGKDLNKLLDSVSDRLIAGTQDAFNGMIYKETDSQTSEELTRANCLRRGVLITATGIYECSGSDLVTGKCGRGTPGAFEEIISDYESEENYQFAEKTIKESSHTYTNSNSILGGFFSSSGIGAVSAAFKYGQSEMSSKAKATAAKTWHSLKIKERSIYAPKTVITLPREGIELSGTALRYLKQIAAADEKTKTEYARLFLANFGGHVFRSVTLGGRYSYVARAESKSKETYDELDEALSEAHQKAGSFAAGFFGGFGLGGASTAHDDQKTSASATSITTTTGKRNQVVRVNIVVHGGLQEMPLDQWKQSLLRDTWWRVIDRREAIAVWDLLRTTESPGFDKDARLKLAELLERVWVEDVFLESLATSRMANYEKFARMLDEMRVRSVCTVKGLESAFDIQIRKLAPPPMSLRYLTVTSKEEAAGGEMEITVPHPWKILSGGGGALGKTGQVLIESYPKKAEIGADGKACWRWHLKTRPAAYENVDQTRGALTIGVILLYDPTDAWDVQLIARKVTSKEAEQDVVVDASGLLITGGGLRIDYYDRPAISGSGFSPDDADATEHQPLHSYHVKTGAVLRNDSSDNGSRVPHSLTAYAIGVRANNGALLEPVYTTLISKKASNHLNEELANASGVGAAMLGGGAWTTGLSNFLSWSLPVVSDSGRGMWRAYSADRAGKEDKQKLQIVTIGLKNVDVRFSADPLPPDFHKYTFTDAYAEWERTKNAEVKR
jgi:hypothetical protein